MEKEYLLGVDVGTTSIKVAIIDKNVDVGTTSIKVAIIDKNAKLLGISSSSYPLITPNQDYVHIDTEGMWQAYLKCIRLLLQGKGISPEKIAGIGISSLCLITPNQDYVHIDTEGMWQAYLKCIRLLLQGKGISPEKIAGIGISSLCPGLAAMDEKGNILVEPIIYSDRRSMAGVLKVYKTVASGEGDFS